MTLHDLVTSSTGNLWRMKLRSFLTISGVVIAIAAFVSMLSFGAGMQQSISEQFSKLGLLSTMLVYPPRGNSAAGPDTLLLDRNAVSGIAGIPGVRLAYPFDALSVMATVSDTQVTTAAQALPVAAVGTRLFSQLETGRAFADDTAREALVTTEFLRMIGVEEPDSVLGLPIVVSVRVSKLDSGVAHVFRGLPERLHSRIKGVPRDSLSDPQFWMRVGREELNSGLARFTEGFLSARAVVSDTLGIVGVLGARHEGGRNSTRPILVPTGTAERLSSSGFSGNPTDLFAALRTGTLFSTDGSGMGKNYPQVTLDLDPNVDQQPIKDSIEALGFRTFSYTSEFAEMRRFFFYFKMGLSVVGLIALVTASLGIVNTMVMSIIERTREIGVLKSLGADDRDVRLLFLAESGMIGTIGAIFGIVFGWVITRIVAVVARMIMVNQGIPEMELFALPLWLILTALTFGLVVSLAAGLYPAARAARVDPVVALRND